MYVSSHYSPEALPDWVGKLEGDVYYKELLRSAGVTLTAVDNGGSMDDVADGVNDASEAEEDTMEGQNVQVVTPVQGSTIGDVDPEPSTPMRSHRHPSTVSHRRSHRQPLQSHRHSHQQ
ncbi:MAG: hypothetical protein NTY03_11685 [Candidatus Bathyarchaeota archaeon]|nr:hypothetical protein [Candidatus Bathyarchaeota archaeon]